MRRRFRAVAYALLGVAGACGLRVSGNLVPGADGGPDGSSGSSGGPISGDDDSGTNPEGGQAPLCNRLCADAGGTCDGGTCVISCTGKDPCGTPKCPSGIPCHVTCNQAGSCDGGVQCSKATSCSVECLMGNACGGTVDCTGGVPPGSPAVIDRCNVVCRDGNACLGTVTAVAMTVNVSCEAENACKLGPTCNGDTCDLVCVSPKACATPKCCAATCTGDGGRASTCP